MYRNITSKISILIVIIIALVYGFGEKRWSDGRLMVYDVNYYYGYLPAALLYQDMNLNYIDKLTDEGRSHVWYNRTPKGKLIFQMTMGNAICWSPFFVIGHLYASIFEDLNDGYSKPYYKMIFIAGIFYLFLGLVMVRKLLKRISKFNDITIAITLFIIGLSTNLLYYASIEPGMSHVINFAIISSFIYVSVIWFEKPSNWHSILAGILLGLLILIRPVNMVLLLFPVLYNIKHWRDFKDKINFFKVNILKIALIALFAFLILFPQMLYWKIMAGKWIYYSYGNQGFFFLDPKIIHGLFSYRKGWLIYAPIMTFSIIGFYYLYKYVRSVMLSVIIIFVAFIYIIYSWWCWWYGGSYGSRPMIDIYGLLSIPLAAFIYNMFTTKLWKKILITVIIVLFTSLNLFQITQYEKFLIHYDSMTKEAYWGIFLKKDFPKNYNDLIKSPDYDKAINGEE